MGMRLVTIGELDAHREEIPELIGIEAVEDIGKAWSVYGIGLLLGSLVAALGGIDALVLDEDNTVSVGSRAICWSKRTLEILDRLGSHLLHLSFKRIDPALHARDLRLHVEDAGDAGEVHALICQFLNASQLLNVLVAVEACALGRALRPAALPGTVRRGLRWYLHVHGWLQTQT